MQPLTSEQQKRISQMKMQAEPILENIESLKGATHAQAVVLMGQVIAIAKSVLLVEAKVISARDVTDAISHTCANMVCAFAQAIKTQGSTKSVEQLMEEIRVDFETVQDRLEKVNNANSR